MPKRQASDERDLFAQDVLRLRDLKNCPESTKNATSVFYTKTGVFTKMTEDGLELPLEPLPKTISASNAFGIPGTICFDSTYLYICIAPNTWKRVALQSF